MNLKKLLVLGWFIVVCVVLPIKRASTDIGAICSVIIGGVFADCILNNSCSHIKIYGAVAAGHICWLGGRAENALDFQLQNTQSGDTSKCEYIEKDGYCFPKDEL